MAQKPLILVIEDEAAQREVLLYNIEAAGYDAIWADNGEDGVLLSQENNPDLVVVDWMMPNLSGIEVCRQLRANPETKDIHIILLTAKSNEVDKVQGLETGADDYITKPFSIKVLIARVNAVLKRSIEVGENKSKDILINGINIKTRSREVWVNKNLINDLTFSEFQILYLLAGHPGWVFTRYQIIDKIRGDNYPVTDRSVDFQIVGLRKKLGDAGKLIKTVRGVGYRFTPDEK